MKKLSILVVCMLMVAVCHGQSKQEDFFKSQYTKLYKNFTKNPSNVVNLLRMAEFYSNQENPMRNLPLAMKYIISAETNYIAIIEDNARFHEAREAMKQGVSITTVRQQKQFILMSARQYVKDNDTISNVELDNFATAFSGDVQTIRIIEGQRRLASFNTAKKVNTMEGYMRFRDTYPGTAESEQAAEMMSAIAATMFSSATTVEEVERRLEPYKTIPQVSRMATKQMAHITFLQADQKNDVKSFRDYVSRYPSGDDYATALDRIAQLLEDQYAKMNTAEELAEFVELNGENPLSEQAMERIRRMIIDKQDAKALHIYLKKFPLDQSYNEIFRLYYGWCSSEGDIQPVMDFKTAYPNSPCALAVQQDLKQEEQVNSLDLMVDFDEARFQEYVSYVRHMTGKGLAFVALQRMMQPLVAQRNWSKCLERMDYVMLSFDEYDVERYQELRTILSAKDNVKNQLVTEVAPSYNMIRPMLHPDGHHLYFSRRTAEGTSISVAEEVTGRGYKWKSEGELQFTNAENKGMEIFCLFDEGNSMLLGKGGDIHVARKVSGMTWTIEEKLPYPVNSDHLETDAFMLPDGSGMLFASDRPYGHDFHRSRTRFHGDTAYALDIYYVPSVDGGWGEPINLGLAINTGYCDRSPVVSRDLKTLYFVTDGRGGLGYGDVYKATREDVSDWTTWSKPVNLGKEVNSGFCEDAVTISHDDKRLFVSSNKKGHLYGCYSTATQHSEGSSLRNVMVDADHLSSELMGLGVVDLTAHSQVKSVDISQTSSQMMKLYVDHTYAVYAESQDGWIPAVVFIPMDKTIVKPESYSPSQLFDMGRIDLRLVGFEHGTDQVDPFGEAELMRLGRFLKESPNVKVEIDCNVAGNDMRESFELTVSRGHQVKKLLLDAGAMTDQVSVSPYGNVNMEDDPTTAEVGIRFKVK